jgi:hypothetical protein
MAAFLPDLPVKVRLLEVTANLDKRLLGSRRRKHCDPGISAQLWFR